MLDAEVAPAAQDILERAVDAGALLLLAAQERDAFAVLAQARQHVAIFGLGLVLVFRHRHEAAADQHHGSAGQHRVEHGRQHQKARDGHVAAGDLERQRAADGPQHDDEGDGGEQGLQQPDREIDGRVGRHAQILGDAVFGILVVAAHQIELEVAALGQPVVEHGAVEPGAPAPLGGHAAIDRRHPEQHAERGEPGEDQRLREHRAGRLLLQRVEEGAIPDIEGILDADIQHDDGDQAAGQKPGLSPLVAAPEAERAAPEPPQQIASPLRSGDLGGGIDRALGLGFFSVHLGLRPPALAQTRVRARRPVAAPMRGLGPQSIPGGSVPFPGQPPSWLANEFATHGSLCAVAAKYGGMLL